jgi:hypothetical protein
MAFRIGSGDTIRQRIPEIERLIRDSLVKELTQQGHILTGKLRDSIELVSRETAKGFEIDGLFLSYGLPINTGVPASRIPYTPGSGRRRSKYISGLIDFVRKRRLAVKESEVKGIAFAIARKQKMQGQPTKGSFKFTKNGRRSNWVDMGLKGVEAEIEKAIEDIWTEEILIGITNLSKSIGGK